MTKNFTLCLLTYLLCFQALSQDLTGFVTVSELSPLPVSKNTGEKPQSKVWSYGCSKWTVLANAEGTHLWRLDNTMWTKVLTLSQTTYNADCKIVGNVAHILLFRGNDFVQLVSLEHVSASNTYKAWSKRPEPSSFKSHRAAETATIDIDGNDRMWLASDASSSVEVRWSDFPYSTWSEAITLATGITDDDISAVIALPGKIGVMWSNLNKQRFGFKTHKDGADPNDWSEDEVPASQSAQDVNLGMADDHINMAVGSDGTLYCAVKTEYDAPHYPSVALLVRRPNGTWDDLYEVSHVGTRPIVILNEAIGKLRVIYTDNVESGNNIVYKESLTSSIHFSQEFTLIKGPYNNATSSKDNSSTDNVILASNEKEAVGVLVSDGAPPEVCSISMGWEVYPNPFNKTTSIYFDTQQDSRYHLTIYSSAGEKITSLSGDARAGEMNRIEIAGEHFASGLYMVKLQTEEKSRVFKVILNK